MGKMNSQIDHVLIDKGQYSSIVDVQLLEEDKIDGACSMHQRDEKCIQHFDWKTCGLYASGSRQGPVMGSCEHGNEPLGSIKGRQFCD